MKVVFAGTPEFAASPCAPCSRPASDSAGADPAGPSGRARHAAAGVRVKQVALAHGIEVLQPLSLRMDSQGSAARRGGPRRPRTPAGADYDVMVVAAYGLILPRSTLDIKPCINIHGSLLPRWRGAAPIHRAIESGDAETGVTIMEMEEGLDTGPMLLMERVAIEDADTTGSLHDKLAALGGRMIVEALRKMEAGALQALPQPEEGVTYAAKISKEEAKLDFSCRPSSWRARCGPSIPSPARMGRQTGRHGQDLACARGRGQGPAGAGAGGRCAAGSWWLAARARCA
jgi:methionyl-tRNA formyltransferase